MNDQGSGVGKHQTNITILKHRMVSSSIARGPQVPSLPSFQSSFPIRYSQGRSHKDSMWNFGQTHKDFIKIFRFGLALLPVRRWDAARNAGSDLKPLR